MAITNNGTKFAPLPKGSGITSLYKDDIVGVLLGIEPREGTYQINDRKTGELITRPNSWTAHFANGDRFSWPTWVDENGEVQPWSRFDEAIDLNDCVANEIPIHVWKDQRGFCHLELVAACEVTAPTDEATCLF